MYYIVEFTASSKLFVEAVPQHWFDNGQVAYPKTKNARQCISSNKVVEPAWPRYPARILHAYRKFLSDLLVFWNYLAL